MPLLLTARHWPQTLLLTALFLLIAAAAAMLACGPAAQLVPADDGALPAVQVGGGGETPDEEPTDTPTPTPELDCVQSPQLPGGEICIEPPPPKVLPKYPALGNFSKYAEVAEESQAAAGASGQSETEVQTVYVRIALLDKASTDAVIVWLESRGVTWFSNRSENDVGRIRASGDDYIYAYVPVSLLVPLSRQEGFIKLTEPEIFRSYSQ